MSIKAVERLLRQYQSEIDELAIPDLIEYSINPAPPKSSPYLTQYKLQHIEKELTAIRQNVITSYKPNTKNYNEILLTCNHLLNTVVDEKSFTVSKLIEAYDTENNPTPEPTAPVQESDQIPPVEDEDLSSLRQRLLAGGKQTQLLDSEQSNERLNNYHESVQDNILNELVDLTSGLKDSALRLSSKILNEDLNILNETNENIIRNSNLFKVIDHNLNHYLENKSGGKISLMFLIKLTLAIVIGFLFMVIIIKIIPKL